MSITKKAISVGLSAALLASLAATVVAPAAFAAITVGSAGNVPVGGTSANNVSFTFTEQAIASLSNNSGTFAVTILDSASNPTVSFTGTPSTAGSTGSLGASASLFAPNVLRVSILGSDTANIESIFVTGLKIKASSTAALGAIKATISYVSGTAFPAATDVGVASAFSAATAAQGTLSTGYASGTTNIVVNVSGATCLFGVTGGAFGQLSFATSPESVNVTAASALGVPGPGQQTLTVAATSNNHQLGESVSQSNTGCGASTALASPGTVVAAISYSSAGNATVYPGELNQNGDNLSFTEPSAGFLAAGSTFTFTILTAGVVFSTAPTIGDNNLAMSLSAPVLAANRLSATVTVNAASTVGGATITLSNILYDVASTVPAGTFIDVGLATSAAQAVLPPDNTNAVVFRGISASAPSPTVYIGENNQTAGLITFKESAAGFFTDGIGTNTNTFSICPDGVGFNFTLAPVAMVVGGTGGGNLILRDGSAASTTNIVVGTNLGNGCYRWTVWTASTTASTIVIGAAPSAATGALINVTSDQAPGGVLVNLNVGNGLNLTDDILMATVQFATAVYRNQVAVTALSQPTIAPGSTNAPVGNIQIAETGLGQLKANEVICFEILWRSGVNQDTFMNSNDTADLPMATASGTGLVISPVNYSERSCSGDVNLNIPNNYMASFSFTVLQQSTAGDGKIVVSNMRDTTLADAPLGPVLVSVNAYDVGGGGTQMDFHSTVSNALIGNVAKTFLDAASATGVTTTGPFTLSTKVVKKGSYITVQIKTTPAMAGAHVGIYIAKKGANGKWSAFSPHTGRIANGSGVVYYYYKAGSVAWLSIRGYFTGDATHAASWSNAVQVKFQ